MGNEPETANSLFRLTDGILEINRKKYVRTWVGVKWLKLKEKKFLSGVSFFRRVIKVLTMPAFG